MSSEAAENISGAQRAHTPPNLQDRANDGDRSQRQPTGWNHGELDNSSQKSQDGLLPAFSTKQYGQLPTPQSPSDSNRFATTVRYSPESPIPQSQAFYAASGSFAQRLPYKNYLAEASVQPNSSQQILTPASSPFAPRNPSYRYDNTATPPYHSTQTMNNSRPPSASSTQFPIASSMLTSPVTPGKPSQMTSAPGEQPAPASTLSSPFMAKAVIPGKIPSRPPSQPSAASRVDDGFSTQAAPSSIPSRPSSSTFDNPQRTPGGEMERIRQAMRDDRLSQAREAENRRPEYLKRAKRSLEEADPEAMAEDGRSSIAVGIMESPHKGRRLKLFQETSEESFEESLMAGGYGRYRTADWVRQPQPTSLPPGSASGASNVVAQLEEVQEKLPPSEKDLKKQRRLDAFRTNRSDGRLKTKLYPVELEGKGRVLLDIPNELPQVLGEAEGSPTKKRNTRRKKGTDAAAEKKALADAAALTLAAEDSVEKPNWPDSEFPWCLRVQEREELAKAEEEDRLKWIERFLDRDSDDDEPEGPPANYDSESERETLPQEQWGFVYNSELEHPPPVRPGRGKMVPLLAHPEDPRKDFRIQRAAFPSDPGNAKSALLAKRSVRALSYRQQRREREMRDEDPDLELCVCGGRDDGRELVQCDGCQTWYHLDCIGIRHIAELGREEDPWFCRRCVTRSPSSQPEPAFDVPIREPTFVPTDNAPRERSVDSTAFFQPSIQDSPNWLRGPKTPTSYGKGGGPDSDYYASSSSSWPDMYRNSPITPKGHGHPVRIHATNTPGGYDSTRSIFEGSPFDPTSTPSRGIRFNAPFATPKSQVWPRPNYGYQTPMRNHQRASTRNSFGGPGSLSAVLDENTSLRLPPVMSYQDASSRYNPYDESPVRRNRSMDATQTRRPFESPISSRLLDESPIMRGKGKERSLDLGRGFYP